MIEYRLSEISTDGSLWRLSENNCGSLAKILYVQDFEETLFIGTRQECLTKLSYIDPTARAKASNRM